jgi:hypothetical protein
MSYLARIEGVPDGDDVTPGMGYFANTGPPDAICGRCKNYGLLNTKGFERKCTEYRRMAGKWGGDLSKRQPACKNFFLKTHNSVLVVGA